MEIILAAIFCCLLWTTHYIAQLVAVLQRIASAWEAEREVEDLSDEAAQSKVT